MRVSIVIPAFNAAATLNDCLRALASQSLPTTDYEVILVDDGSSDATAEIAQDYGVRLIHQKNQGAPSARNRGIEQARAPWVAFTDADCIPSRGWLRALLTAVESDGIGDTVGRPIGAAGRTLGYASHAPASRFVDISGGLDAERHLGHPRFPFAPSSNLIYRRHLLVQVGGFDERFHTFDACDLHTRLLQLSDDQMLFAPAAVVLHRHRADWFDYLRQQQGYGYGYGQFVWRYRDCIDWSLAREAGAWGRLLHLGLLAAAPGRDDHALLRRGQFLKQLGQRIGFVEAYYARSERSRW